MLYSTSINVLQALLLYISIYNYDRKDVIICGSFGFFKIVHELSSTFYITFMRDYACMCGFCNTSTATQAMLKCNN